MSEQVSNFNYVRNDITYELGSCNVDNNLRKYYWMCGIFQYEFWAPKLGMKLK